MTTDPALTPAVCADAAAAQGLAAACIAAPAVEDEIDRLYFRVDQLTIELALGHAFRARERAGR
jgi:hypothetical protein